MKSKNATSSAAVWALLAEGVTSARIEAYRLRHLLMRAHKIIEKIPGEQREAVYEVAGDIIMAIPPRLDSLETVIDRTSYALTKIGEPHLRERLPLSDRVLVDEAVHKTRPWSTSVSRVAKAYLRRQEGR